MSLIVRNNSSPGGFCHPNCLASKKGFFMEGISLTSMFFSIACGVIASWLFLKIQKYRTARLKSKIKDLDFEIEFLDRIGSGYKELIRVSIRVMCFALFLCCIGTVLIIADSSLALLIHLKPYTAILSMTFYGSAGAIFFMHFRSLYQLTDKENVQMKLNEKKQRLENKL